MRKSRWIIYLVLALAAPIWVGGCQSVPEFPNRPTRVQITSDGSKVLYFDTNKDRRIDYWQRENGDGRKVELRFDGDKEAPSETIFLDNLDAEKVPHFIIALDGVPYRLVEELYGEGSFRLFHPPARVVSTFPAMTDLAFQRIFGGRKPVAYQAEYFDREKNKLIDGTDIYLSGEAADWSSILDYRCSFKLDAVAYINPDLVFEHELREIMKVLREAKGGTKIVYSVGTAGLGTQGGREAILRYLRTIDQLCEQIVYERGGMVKFSLMADHGNNMSGRGKISFEKRFKENGYRLRDKLEKTTDVVTVELGLVTYAAFFTEDPAGVARVALEEPATTIACYPQTVKDQTGQPVYQIVVQSIDGRAFIRRSAEGRYIYITEFGDPLDLEEIIESLKQAGKVDEQGGIDDGALFQATIQHLYPDPLRRIWEAFNGLVEKPADLIVCLKDGWVHGSTFYNVMIGGATSTHGSLNQINSMTFAMTMLGPLPEAMRLEEVMPSLQALQLGK